MAAHQGQTKGEGRPHPLSYIMLMLPMSRQFTVNYN